MKKKNFSHPKNDVVRQESHATRRKISKILIHALLLLLVIINIFPLYWMITFSLKSNDEIQGYKMSAEKTRWEEIEDSIIGVTGDLNEIAWDAIKGAIISSSNTAARKDPALQQAKDPNAATVAREKEISGIIEENWEEIKTRISGIEGFFDADRTEEANDSEYMTGVYAQIETIVNDVVARNVLIKSPAAEGVEPEEAVEEGADEGYEYVFVISSNNYKKRIRNAMSKLFKLQSVDGADPWGSVKSSISDIMGDMSSMLDEPETVYVPPNHIGLPKALQWSNYESAMKTGNMGLYFLNSLVVSASAIIITLVAAFMATYAMTRLVWKGRKMMNKFFMLGLTIPIHAAIVPVYIILANLRWLNTYQALIIPYAAFSLSMAILISVGFMGDIPYDLDEAAFLDGCGVWGIFFRVIFPLMMPAVATVGIYTFLQCWNELLFATIFVSSGDYRTLPVGVQQLFGQYTTDWGPIGAALSIATLPTLIVYIALSKRIQAGFIAGAVKG